jgi:hypothetical protein
MTEVRDYFHRKKAPYLVIVALSFGIGFLGGRLFAVDHMLKSFLHRLMTPSSELPPAPALMETTKTYAELNALLDRRLEDEYRKHSQWSRLLRTSSRSEQTEIVTEMRADFLELLRPWPGPGTELNAKGEFWFTENGVETSLVQLETQPGVRLLCALMLPQNINGPRPALLLLHGTGGSLQAVLSDIDYHHGFGIKLAQSGFVVLAPLMLASKFEAASTLYVKSLAGEWNLDAIELWQLVRMVDYLHSLEQVDPGHIGTYGMSRGGQSALRLGAIDQRISLTICSGYLTDRFSWLFRRQPVRLSYVTLTVPSMTFLLDDLNLVALIQPRFFGVESGRNTSRHSTALAEFQKVSQLYRHNGHPERAVFQSFDGGHETSVEGIMPFLRRWANTAPIE